LLDQGFIEKNFIYLVALSLALHLLLAAVIVNLPQPTKPLTQEPVMVDLQDLPEPKASQPAPDEVKRLDEFRRRVPREMAPRGDAGLDRLLPSPPTPQPRTRPQTPTPPALRGKTGDMTVPEPQPRRGEGLFRVPATPQPTVPDLNRLMPSAERLAKLEESYRRKFREQVEEGDAHFLNTNDLQFGSFLRRFETAVYGVWRYPQEAVRLGIEGMTPVRITFNRQGEVENVTVLESSGSKILDEEVLRTLRKVGKIGSFPRGYDKESFTLIAFFHYGIASGARSLR
jgi:protein TonB